MDQPAALPSLDELLAASVAVGLPMRTKFRSVTEREIVLFHGPKGWSEFSPFLEYEDAEASNWLKAAIEFGWQETPTTLRNSIDVNATLPAVEASQVPAILDRYDGCRTVKVKVAEPGQTLVDDLVRVEAARTYLGSDGNLRVDANGNWSVDEAELALGQLAEFRLEYAEQPCRTVSELSELRERIAGLGVRIAADESVRKATDPLEVARLRAADILVIKAQPLGGIRSALQIVQKAGLPVVVSSALDSSVGLSMGAHLAASLDSLDFACGLGTAALFSEDVAGHPLLPSDGAIPVTRVEPDPERISALRLAPERQSWWRSRIERCYQLLN